MNPAKVHAQDSNRPGVFWIGVTIPRGKQIENPYDLIIELRDKFQELYMTQLSDGSYEFINVPYKADVFKNIVDKYKLVGLQSSYVEMTGTKMQILSLKSDDDKDSAETKIIKFFCDTQYIELEDCSSVIVAEQIEGTSLLSVEVPHRPGHYVVKAADVSVIENSGFNGVRLSNIPDDIDRKLILTICKNEHTFEIENNYKKSNYQVEIGEIEKRISAYRYIRPDDISDCLIKSKRYYYNFSNRNYIKRIGWLVFEQKK